MSVNAYLLKDFDVTFIDNISCDWLGSITSQITMSPENVSTTDSNELSWNLCHRLRQSLAALDVEQRQMKIKCVSAGCDVTQKTICLEGTWINHLVEEIGVDMKLKVTLREGRRGGPGGRGAMIYGDTKTPDICTAGMVPRYSCSDWVLMYEGSLFNASGYWPNANGGDICAKLTITMSGLPNKALKKHEDETATSIRAEQSEDLVLFSNKIFNEQFETDVVIVSANGSKHPCHKIFLTGNSPVFQAIFKGESFKEGQTKSVTLENLSEKGVVALMNHLYCVDSEDVEAEYDSEICMELLEASEEYSMSNLQESMKRVFLSKPCDWLQVDTALQLFCFSRNVENCKELVDKCIQVLKSKLGEMRNSEDYKKLFQKNPEAAMDLCYLLSK